MKNKDYKWTFSEILERFEYIEKKLHLDESIIQGVTWWDTLRYQLFNELLDELGPREEIKKNKMFTIKKFVNMKIFTIIHILKNFLKLLSPKSPLWVKRESIIVLGHPRRKLEKGVYVDLYTDPFIDLFPEKIDFSVIERSEGNGHLSPAKTKNLFYADSLYSLANIISKFRKLKFNQNDLLTISHLEKTLYSEFSCAIDIHKRVRKIIQHWLGFYPLMRFFFKLKKPKLLFVVVSHAQEAIIAAAKSLGITTIELQHGSPARGKLNYDYSSGIKKISSPDLFLSFGDYWSSNCKFPFDEDKIISFGKPYLYKKINSYSHIVKEDRLVIISQGLPKLAKFAQDISRQFSKKIIVEYKPHPRELYEQEPDYFIELRNAGVVISHKHADLYDIFARSRWQVGVFSTALYEGLYFGTACFVVNTTGSEHMKRLINFDLARLISSPTDIDLNWKIDKKDIKKIFSEPSKENIEYIISLIK